MRKICIVLLFSFLAYSLQVQAQEKQTINPQQTTFEKQPLSAYDSMMLSHHCPTGRVRNAQDTLLYMVDKFELPYFSGLWWPRLASNAVKSYRGCVYLRNKCRPRLTRKHN